MWSAEERAQGLEYMHPKPSSHSGRIVGKPESGTPCGGHSPNLSELDCIQLGQGYGCPSRRCIFPLVICQRPLTGAIRVHHKELAIGLRNVVVKRSFVFES